MPWTGFMERTPRPKANQLAGARQVSEAKILSISETLLVGSPFTVHWLLKLGTEVRYLIPDYK